MVSEERNTARVGEEEKLKRALLDKFFEAVAC